MDFSTARCALKSLLRRIGSDESREEERACAMALLEALGDKDSLDEECFPRTEEAEARFSVLLASPRWDALSLAYFLTKGFIGRLSARYHDDLILSIERNLQHIEPRIRSLATELLGELSRAEGVAMYSRFRDLIVSGLREHIHPESSEQLTGEADGKVGMELEAEARAAETLLGALTAFVRGCGPALVSDGLLSLDILQLAVEGGARHGSRHVRESAFLVAQAVCETQGELSTELTHLLATALAAGLSDPWCEVRYNASVAARSFLGALSPAQREAFYPIILPRICLNRVYMAEGVKLYSQATWKQVVDDGGQVVASLVSSFVAYYVESSRSPDFGIREAACHSIGELALKVDATVVLPFVTQLIHALLVAVEDKSWPVRDAACIATSKFVTAFPSAIQPYLSRLYPQWFRQLQEPIASVREDTAVALAAVVRAYGQEALRRVEAEVRDRLPCAQSQPPDGPGDHASRHDEQPMVYCDSMSSRLAGGRREPPVISGPAHPWEISDGAIFMVRELASPDLAPALAASLLPTLAELCELHHFRQADHLRESIYKSLPLIAQRVGKTEFKRHGMEGFMRPLFRSATSLDESHQSKDSAHTCIHRLSTLIGREIFAGRLPVDLRESFDRLVPPL